MTTLKASAKKVEATKAPKNNKQAAKAIETAKIKSTTPEGHKALLAMNKAFKDDTFSLFGIINYTSKKLASKDKVCLSMLDFKAFKGIKSQADAKKVLTIDYLKKCLGEKGLHHWSKDANGKMTIKGEARSLFSPYMVWSAIRKHEKAQK